MIFARNFCSFFLIFFFEFTAVIFSGKSFFRDVVLNKQIISEQIKNHKKNKTNKDFLEHKKIIFLSFFSV